MADVCLDCAYAAEEDHWLFTGACKGCAARAAARSPQFFAVRKAGGKSGPETRGYRALLDQYGVTHDQVREAAAADAFMRSRP